MAYSTYEDVLHACGLTLKRITDLHEGDMTDTQVQDMIEDMIDEADQQIRDLIEIPITIKEEIHEIDEDISLTKVYLGNYDESYVGDESLDVQAAFQRY